MSTVYQPRSWLLGVLAAILIGCGQKPTPTSRAASSTTAKALSAITYSEVRESYAKGREKLWKADKKYFAGKRVQWTGSVASVEQSGSEHWVKIDLNPDSFWKLWDVTFRVEEADASKLKRGQEITFQGDIADLQGIVEGPRLSVQVWLEDAEIIR